MDEKTTEFKMKNGNVIKLGERVVFEDIWSGEGDEVDLLKGGRIYVGEDIYGLPMIVSFDILNYDEENPRRTLVKLISFF